MKRLPRSFSRRLQAGLSLVELMVGLAVGMLLVAGLALLFANSSQSAGELEKSLRQIENGRYAVDLLAEDLSVAGYYGEAIAETLDATVSPCADPAAVAADLEDKRAATPPSLPFAVEGLTGEQAALLSCLPDHATGTPALVVRRLDTTPLDVTAIAPGEVYLQSSNDASDVNATYVAGTDASNLTLKDKDGTTNRVRRYLSRVYYVASCSDCGRDTIPTLKRAELRAGGMVAVPVSEGIERIGFDYGFDTSGDGAPDSWLGLNGDAGAPEAMAAAALGWHNVVAVRVHVLARTTETSAGFADTRSYALGLEGGDPYVVPAAGDAFKRRVYTTTARLNSIAGHRE